MGGRDEALASTWSLRCLSLKRSKKSPLQKPAHPGIKYSAPTHLPTPLARATALTRAGKLRQPGGHPAPRIHPELRGKRYTPSLGEGTLSGIFPSHLPSAMAPHLSPIVCGLFSVLPTPPHTHREGNSQHGFDFFIYFFALFLDR